MVACIILMWTGERRRKSSVAGLLIVNVNAKRGYPHTMFKATAYKNGVEVKIAMIKDDNEIKTLSMEQALYQAKWTLAENGVEFDHVEVKFTRLSVCVQKLNALFNAPNDPELERMENDFLK